MNIRFHPEEDKEFIETNEKTIELAGNLLRNKAIPENVQKMLCILQ